MGELVARTVQNVHVVPFSDKERVVGSFLTATCRLPCMPVKLVVQVILELKKKNNICAIIGDYNDFLQLLKKSEL